MRIPCDKHNCIYCTLGECSLKRAASAGKYESGCAYYVEKA